MSGEDCPFKVVRTNGHDEVLARAVNLLIGRAAFETAKRLYPGACWNIGTEPKCWIRAGAIEAEPLQGVNATLHTGKSIAYVW